MDAITLVQFLSLPMISPPGHKGFRVRAEVTLESALASTETISLAQFLSHLIITHEYGFLASQFPEFGCRCER